MMNFKKYALYSCILVLALLLVGYSYRTKVKHKLKALLGYSTNRSSGGSGSCPGCSTIFTDNVKVHQLAFSKEGIAPQKEDEDLYELFTSGKLVKLQTNPLYIVRQTRFSRPYILPNAKVFIEDLAVQYKQKCTTDSITYVPFTISSSTRSLASVNALMKNNDNAIRNSAHLRGTTIDISYRAFNKNKKQTKAFINVLAELRRQNRCYVKFERNCCLHITVI